MTHDTHTFCRAFGSGALATCFYDVGLSWPGIEPRSPACEANAPPLRHRGGLMVIMTWCFTTLGWIGWHWWGHFTCKDMWRHSVPDLTRYGVTRSDSGHLQKTRLTLIYAWTKDIASLRFLPYVLTCICEHFLVACEIPEVHDDGP